MPSAKSSDPVTAYSRHRISEWIASGRQQRELSERGGFAKSATSQVLSGKLGVGKRLEQGLAKAFGMKVSDYVRAAEEWWESTGKNIAQAAETSGAPEAQAPEIPEAISRALDIVRLSKNATNEELHALLAVMGPLDRLGQLNVEEIYQVLSAYLNGARREKLALRAEAKAAAIEKRTAARRAQSEWVQRKRDGGHHVQPGQDAAMRALAAERTAERAAKGEDTESAAPPKPKRRRHAN